MIKGELINKVVATWSESCDVKQAAIKQLTRRGMEITNKTINEYVDVKYMCIDSKRALIDDNGNLNQY